MKGKMALLSTGESHVTYEKTDLERDYDSIFEAGKLAREAVLPGNEDFQKLCRAVRISCEVQYKEGMKSLPSFGEAAKKYCGGGWGGYALYLFENEKKRSDFLEIENTMAIEPFLS